ncbi:MAG: hypothetical protein M3Q81_05820, partial [bacterium]|nr:hypothetical protein [bacterium]
MRNHSQSWYFQDETDHVTMGWMMHRFDKVLYQDLSTNHQPLPVLVGNVLTQFIPYNTLYILIERLRLVMFGVTALTSILLTLRFGLKGAVAAVATFSVSYWYFGWHILQETLAIPALLFIFMLLIEYCFFRTNAKKEVTKIQYWDSFLFGLSLFWLTFTLLPLAPFVIGSIVLFLLCATKKESLIAFISGLAPTLILFSFIPLNLWFEETILNNVRYLLPEISPLTVTQQFQLIFYPFLSFLNPGDVVARNFLFSTVLLILSSIVLAVKMLQHIRDSKQTTSQFLSKNRFFIVKSAVLLAMFISLNTRVYENPNAFFTGFHLYPYIAGFAVIVSYLIVNSFHHTTKVTQLAIVLLCVGWLANNSFWMLEKKNKTNESYIQYGTFDSVGRAIKIMKTENSTVFSGPDGHGY